MCAPELPGVEDQLLDCDWGDCGQCERGTVAAVLYSWSRLELRGVVRVFSRPELCLLLSMSQAFKDASQQGHDDWCLVLQAAQTVVPVWMDQRLPS
jgi:hypothetical protein